MSSNAKAAAGLVAIVVAVGLFLVLRSDSDDDGSEPIAAEQQATTVADEPTVAEEDDKPGDSKPQQPKPEEPAVPTIVVKDVQPVGGVLELSFKAGDEIRFVVESDVDEEVHFHGYDVSQDVTAGGRVEFNVPATLEGVFEVELEHSVVPIAEISVNPA